jgi:hypothetical protein
LFIERRLAGLVGHLGAGFGNLGAQLAQHGFSPPSHAKISAANPRRPAAELRQHKASHLVDHGFVRLTADQFALGLHEAQLQHLGLDRDVGSISLRARRLLPLAPQVPQVGNAALVEREAAALPLDTPSASSLPM